ncbi:MAG: peptidase C39 family protein [Nitrospiraceae bacterium]|jgi:predicted double-glycine peptidase|nr:MAG: peptidase C39 family protein [Nitrospiraceae bacterium]
MSGVADISIFCRRQEFRRAPQVPAFFHAIFLIFALFPAVAGEAGEPVKGILIEKVPFFVQEDYQCGPASLAGVLNFWGVTITPAEIAEEVFSRSARGALGIDLALYAQKKGFQSDFYRGDAENLRRQIDSGRPVIVLVDYGFWVYEKGHFMVVIGYNDDGFIVNTGASRMKFIANDDFTGPWRKAGFWTLVIRP